MADMQNKHKEHCQRIFDKQNKWLSNPEPEISEFDWESNDEDGEYGKCKSTKLIGIIIYFFKYSWEAIFTRLFNNYNTE
jgi:hypothetical protein